MKELKCKDGTTLRITPWPRPFKLVKVYYADGDVQLRAYGDVPDELRELADGRE